MGLHVILFGCQGSGKGTQAGLLKERLRFTHISTGELIRRMSAEGDEDAIKIKGYTDKGNLAPDDYIIDLVAKSIRGAENVVYDGFPRNLKQAQALSKVATIDYSITLHIKDEEALKRLSKRRICASCGISYTTDDLPDKCECTGQLIQRDDDKPESIEKRLAIYHENNGTLAKYYVQRSRVITIDGSKPIPEVFDRICNYLKLNHP